MKKEPEALDAHQHADGDQGDRAHDDDPETTGCSAGPASGSSTAQNRCQAGYPTAVADCRTSGSTDPNASAAERAMRATA